MRWGNMAWREGGQGITRARAVWGEETHYDYRRPGILGLDLLVPTDDGQPRTGETWGWPLLGGVVHPGSSHGSSPWRPVLRFPRICCPLPPGIPGHEQAPHGYTAPRAVFPLHPPRLTGSRKGDCEHPGADQPSLILAHVEHFLSIAMCLDDGSGNLLGLVFQGPGVQGLRSVWMFVHGGYLSCACDTPS